MNYLAWSFAVLTAVALTCAVIIVLVVTVRWASEWLAGQQVWPGDRFCANPNCGHLDYDHDFESPGGVCSHLPCHCRRFKP